MENPMHPAVDWTRTRHNRERNNRVEVWIICPICGKERWADAGSTRYRIIRNRFDGRCKADRLLGKAQSDWSARPPHPAVDWTRPTVIGRRTLVPVTCPVCEKERWCQPNAIIVPIRNGRFTGTCLPCSPRAKKREWVVLGPGRKINPKDGSIRLGREAIAPADLPLYDAMRKHRSYILEHRFVMAKHLDRPVEPYELVDHMDGNRTHNDLGNLRLYIRGKNMPGSQPGYGVFYHEWQMALARIRELEAMLANVA